MWAFSKFYNKFEMTMSTFRKFDWSLPLSLMSSDYFLKKKTEFQYKILIYLILLFINN